MLVKIVAKCPGGEHRIHGSLLGNKPKDNWQGLFGWHGFRSATATQTVAVSAPAIVAPSVASGRQWRAWLVKVGASSEDDWVPMPDFLQYVGGETHHSSRFVDGKSRRSWRLGPGKGNTPTFNTDWTYRKTKKGGGAGKATYMGRCLPLNA